VGRNKRSALRHLMDGLYKPTGLRICLGATQIKRLRPMGCAYQDSAGRNIGSRNWSSHARGCDQQRSRRSGGGTGWCKPSRHFIQSII